MLLQTMKNITYYFTTYNATYLIIHQFYLFYYYSFLTVSPEPLYVIYFLRYLLHHTKNLREEDEST